MQSKIDLLREINLKLLAEITELRKENAKIKAENAKLKYALEEHEARFTNLEQRDKEKTTLITKLDSDIRKIKQEQNAVNILTQSNNTSIPRSPNYSITSQSSILSSIEGADQTNIVVDQYDTTESAKRFNSKSFKNNREIDSFLDEMTHPQLPVTSVSSYSLTSLCSKKNVKKLYLKEGDKQNTLSHQKILYREKVERGLRQELSSFCSKDSDGRVFDIQIPKFSLEAILIGFSKITAQTIVDLFNVAIKVRHKEILCWYCYYKAYKDQIRDIKSTNKIDD
ncbi:hypothetical protein GLOIN_2v1869616 [Rhizophagus clarus]|uniref:Uncharacterized protein n=1 Tax=Rhizophagus clarus TaxID=94130 RepID=A0A8H3R8K9_9GLOM|nr:hypothetical protein GLOIN_2v1869616 [Rhizophagus clarus]